MNRNFLLITAAILLIFNSISALFGGWHLMLHPDGSSMEMSPDWLEASPFSDYLIPGIILFTLNGVLSLVVFMAVLMKQRNYPSLVMLQGVILFGWIAIQVAMLREFIWIQALFGGIGLVMIVLGWLLKTKK